MNRYMDLNEFAEYIESKTYKKILFSSVDQKKSSSTLMFRFSFNKIDVFPHLGFIFLQDHNNRIAITEISRINVDTKRTLLGACITIYQKADRDPIVLCLVDNQLDSFNDVVIYSVTGDTYLKKEH